MIRGVRSFFCEEPQDYLWEFLRIVLDNDKPVKNIDLSGIPHDIAIPVIGTVAKLVYGIQRML